MQHTKYTCTWACLEENVQTPNHRVGIVEEYGKSVFISKTFSNVSLKPAVQIREGTKPYSVLGEVKQNKVCE